MAKKIVLDAGHALEVGGNQTPDGIAEWTLNNKVALAVAKQLADYDVTISRADDVTGKRNVLLSERVSRTNRIMPDAFVSIHHNAYMSKWGTHTGVEVFYNSKRSNDIEKTLANNISTDLAANTGLKNRGAKTAAFAVLTCDASILAILVEGGFMDSTIDHAVITSAKGQDDYARAISDGLIKQLKLVKKSKTSSNKPPRTAEVTSPETVKVGAKYIQKSNTNGYYTAADAKALKDSRINVLAGKYWVYNLAHGMINITKTKGYPGSWINPENSIETTIGTQPAAIGQTYNLNQNTPGFYTAADAKARRHARVTVLAGEYTVFNILEEMVNLTKAKGQPGSWINPETAIGTTTGTQPAVIGQTYNLNQNTPGFYTAADAKARRHARVTVLAGEYTVFKSLEEMVNLTKIKEQPGSWINPT